MDRARRAALIEHVRGGGGTSGQVAVTLEFDVYPDDEWPYASGVGAWRADHRRPLHP